MFSSKARLGLTAATALTAFTSAVYAQPAPESQFARDRNVSVLERPRPEFVVPPLRAGAFIVNADLLLGVEYDSNVFARDTDEEGDAIAIIAPRIIARSDWSRHALDGEVRAARREYAENSDESFWTTFVRADGRADVSRSINLTAGLSHLEDSESRAAAGVSAVSETPIDFSQTGFSAGVERTRGRISLEAGFDLDVFDYDDARLPGGTLADQDFRDRDNFAYTVRGDFALSPDTAAFARVRLADSEHDQADASGRDSNTVTIDAGADFDLSNLARGEVAFGFTSRDFDGDTFQDTETASVDARVEWFPSGLTTVTLNATRAIDDAGLEFSGGFVVTGLGAEVDHELLRNLIVSGQVSWRSEDYLDIDRTDDRTSLGVSATWLANPRIGVRGSLDYVTQDSSGAAGLRDFSRSVLGVSLVLRP